ncbi:antigen like protein, partial [Clarias magur]
HQRPFWKTCLCVSLLCCATCAGSQVVIAREGVAAALPCKFNNATAQTPYVQWRTDPKVVFERWDTDSYEGPGYEGRVDVPEDELRNGNCSLVLKSIRKSDEGIYNSYLLWRRLKRSAPSSWSLIHRVQLSVSVPKERSKTAITPT